MQAFDGVQELGALVEALMDSLQKLWPKALTQETAKDTRVLELRVSPILQLRKGRIFLVHILAGDRIPIADRVLQDADRLAVFVLKDAPQEGQTDMNEESEADEESQADSDKKAEGADKIVKKRFVKLGRRRGDLVAVIDGLKPGEVVATSGLLKLRNDAPVTIENDVRPSADATPTPGNS